MAPEKKIHEMSEYAFVAALLLLFTILTLTSMSQKSVTNDEALHIASGYSYITLHDFRMNPEHPPLIKSLSALPLLFLDISIDTSHNSWTGQQKWEFGSHFLFDNSADPDTILFWARVPIVFLAILLGIYVYLWSKLLFGKNAGFLALFLYTLSPNILAHARLVTTELGLAAFMAISLYHYYIFLKSPSIRNLALSGITLGLALASKFTAIYLIPIFIILGGIRFHLHTRDKTFSIYRLINFTLQILIIFFISVLVLMPIYQFQGIYDNQEKQDSVGKIMQSGPLSALSNSLVSLAPVPSRYIYGLAFVSFHSTAGHEAFLLGQHSSDGWWYYFPFAFLVKTPVPLLILAIYAVYLLFRRLKAGKPKKIPSANHQSASPSDVTISCRDKTGLLEESFLHIPIIFIFLAFMLNNINIGLRHILPIYPLIHISVSRVACIPKSSFKKSAFAFLLIWYLLGTLLISPHFLAYFNEPSGGPRNGHNLLIDSNLDWGQDLKSLGEYVHQNNISHVYLGYFGKGSPKFREINYTQLPCYPVNGIVAISYSLFEGITKDQADCASWLRSYQPAEVIGHTITVYQLNMPSSTIESEREEYCIKGCLTVCKTSGLAYGSSSFNTNTSECDCTCKADS